MSVEISDEEAQAFWAHVAQLESEHGIALTEADKHALGRHVIENGFTPDVTRDAFATMAGAAESHADAHAPANDPGAQQFVADINADLERLETRLGRKLTTRELDGMQERMAEGMRKAGPASLDAGRALESFYEDQGRKIPDMNNRHDRVAHMVERLNDAEQAEREQQAPEPDRVYDPDKHEDRVALIMHRMEGGEVEDAPEEEPE